MYVSDQILPKWIRNANVLALYRVSALMDYGFNRRFVNKQPISVYRARRRILNWEIPRTSDSNSLVKPCPSPPKTF